MAFAKTATRTFSIEPDLKEAVRTAAGNGYRFIANMIAVMIRNYCGRGRVDIAEPQALPAEERAQTEVTQAIIINHTPLPSRP
jgi:hypothetical protein